MRARFFHLTIIPIAAVALYALLNGHSRTEQALAQKLTAASPERQLAGSYNAVGQDLFKQFAAEPGKNIVFSPYSIGAAMTMAVTGARTNTETEMLKVLKLGLPRVEIDNVAGRLMAILNSYDQSKLPPTCPARMQYDGQQCIAQPSGDKCPFASKLDGFNCVAAAVPLPWAKVYTANALMMPKVTDDISFQYVDLLKAKYGAEVFRGVGLADINNWVSQKTDGKIEKILERLDPSSPAVLLNAIYFKANWATSFNKSATIDANFNLSRSRQIRVPMMQQVGRFAVITRHGYRALKMPYAVKSLSMIVVLPDEMEGINLIAGREDDKEFGEMFASFRKVGADSVAVSLPRFKTKYEADLKQPFQQMGMVLAFSRTQADFSGMTGRPPSKGGLMIGQIRHAAMIDVQEEGTEAAGATAVVMMPAALRPKQPDPFLVDRPFLFYVVDEVSGAILFQGRINDPR